MSAAAEEEAVFDSIQCQRQQKRKQYLTVSSVSGSRRGSRKRQFPVSAEAEEEAEEDRKLSPTRAVWSPAVVRVSPKFSWSSLNRCLPGTPTARPTCTKAHGTDTKGAVNCTSLNMVQTPRGSVNCTSLKAHSTDTKGICQLHVFKSTWYRHQGGCQLHVFKSTWYRQQGGYQLHVFKSTWYRHQGGCQLHVFKSTWYRHQGDLLTPRL